MKQTLRTAITVATAALAAVVVLLWISPDAGAAERDFTVVIDAGHGAHDAGAVGVMTTEKAINLGVATKLAAMIRKQMKDAKVVMTRDDDTFVPLQGRADIANRSKADVFISIHANSVDKKSKNRDKVHGAAVYTLGLDRSETNLSVAMRENEVMKLEKDYTTTYSGFDPSSTESYIMFDIIQHSSLNNAISLAQEVQKELVATAGRKNNGVKQAPFWVLVRTSMPAILVELDFICNPEMEKFMASEQGQTRLATAIYNGLRNYRRLAGHNFKESKTKTEPAPESKPESQPATTVSKPVKSSSIKPAAATDTVDYRIQFLTSGSRLNPGSSALGGMEDAECYEDGGVWKYTVGHFASPGEASAELKRVRKKFPEAFVVKMQGDKRIR